jgi:hypothetical protein
MKYGIYFLVLAALMLSLAIQFGGWYWTMIYPSLSFAIVAIGYLGGGPRVFGKRPDGKRSLVATFFLLPYLLFTLGTWQLVRLVSREPAVNQVDADLYLSRRLLRRELPETVTSVVDLTCEFTAPTYECSYYCFPVLDASCPSAEELKNLAKKILDLPKPVLIHCAQGHGRTGLVASAVLFESGKANSPEDALALVQSVRPGVELNAIQKQALLSLKVPTPSN